MVVAFNPSTTNTWQAAQWDDYLAQRDRPFDEFQRTKLYFYQQHLYLEMGKEGINHATVSDLFTMLFFVVSGFIDVDLRSFGRCLLEKPSTKEAASPDLILFLGDDYPKWQQGERRYLNLDQCRVPDLVGEISDTTIFHDLDQKKELYAALEIPEYWVIDVQAQRVFLLVLNDRGRYEPSETSQALPRINTTLLKSALERLDEDGNAQVAHWLATQLS